VIPRNLVLELGLQLERGLDKGRRQTGDDVPFYVTVEEPDAYEAGNLVVRNAILETSGTERYREKHTRVVSLEPQYNVTVRIENKRVSPHRDGREVGCGDVGLLEEAGLFLGPPERLEVVAVEMKGMTARVDVVDDDVDNLVLLEDERMGVLAVDFGISRLVAGTENCVQRGNLGSCVGYVIEEGAVAVLVTPNL
jgi:hypothetical protein